MSVRDLPLTTPMTHFLIRSLNIPSAEVALLKTIMRLSTETMGSWKFVDEGRCDVLLVDGQTRDGRIGTSGARHVVRVGSRRDPGPDETLLRPLRAEEFIALLNTIYLAEQRTASLAPRALVSTDATSFNRERKCVLTRWPPSALLNADKSRVRLATLLSRSPQSVNRLAMLTNMSADYCEEFVRLLDSHRLVRWQSLGYSARHPAASTRSRSGQPGDDADPSSPGFVASIRRRLGL